jgi:cyclohexanecarboxylate-CoA ligase
MRIDDIRGRMRAEWRSRGVHQGVPVFDAVTAAALAHGEDLQTFFDETGSRDLTLGQIYETGLSLAAGLRGFGVGVGDTVAVHLPNSPEAFAGYVAAWAVGATLVPIPSIYGSRETGHILRDSSARVLVTASRWRSQEYLTAIPGYRAGGDLEHVVVVGGDEHPYLRYSDIAALPAERVPAPDIDDPDRPAVIVYTSGSTSNPKGGVHSNDTIVYEVRQNYPVERMAGSVWLNAAPAGHMGGLLAALKLLFFGAPGVWLDRWSPSRAVELIQERHITAATLVPFHVMTLLEAMKAAGVEHLGLRDVLCGSTAVPTALIENADAHGVTAYRTYGSTEHPTISKSFPSDPLAVRSRTDGRILPETVVRVLDDDDNEVPDGAEGEIVSIGPDQFLGYTTAEDNAASFTPDGFFRTGDLGRVEDGVLTITGRKKEIIIRGGENISVREIEEILLEHPDVREAAVVPRTHEKYGEQVWAFMETVGHKPLTLSDVQQHFTALGVARQKIPEGVVVVDEFPRTAAGKVSKRDLRATFAD